MSAQLHQVDVSSYDSNTFAPKTLPFDITLTVNSVKPSRHREWRIASISLLISVGFIASWIIFFNSHQAVIIPDIANTNTDTAAVNVHRILRQRAPGHAKPSRPFSMKLDFVNDGKLPLSHFWRANALAANWTSQAHLYNHLDNINQRADIAKLAEAKKMQVGVELGVQRALYSAEVLDVWKSCLKYILVDTWRKAPEESFYLDPANVDDYEQDGILTQARENVKRFKGVPVFVRNMTVLAAALVPDNSVDFIYVDARHDYCGCKEDMEVWWPKLKVGGIMSGHDYMDAIEQWQYSRGETDDWSYCQDGTRHLGAVKGAVDEFAKRMGLTVYTTRGGRGNPNPAFKESVLSWFLSEKTKL